MISVSIFERIIRYRDRIKKKRNVRRSRAFVKRKMEIIIVYAHYDYINLRRYAMHIFSQRVQLREVKVIVISSLSVVVPSATEINVRLFH